MPLMPLAAIAEWFLTSKIGQAILIACAALTAFVWWSLHEVHKGRELALEAQKAATAAELERVRGVLVETQQKAQQAVARQHALEMSNAQLLARVNAPRAVDRDSCLDGIDSSLLDSIRRPVPQGTGGAARPTAR